MSALGVGQAPRQRAHALPTSPLPRPQHPPRLWTCWLAGGQPAWAKVCAVGQVAFQAGALVSAVPLLLVIAA